MPRVRDTSQHDEQALDASASAGMASPAEPVGAGEVADQEARKRAATRRGRQRRQLQVVVAIAVVVIAALVLYLIRDTLGAFILGALLAFLINPLVDRLERLMPRPLAIVIVFAGLSALLAALATLFIPAVSEEVSQLQSQAPTIAAEAQQRLELLQQGQPIEIIGYQLNLSSATKNLDKSAADLLLGQFGNALSIGLAAVNLLLQTLLMLIVAFLVSLDAHRISALARLVVPPDYREDFDEIWPRLKHMLRSYLRGQLTVAAIIGVSVWIALELEHVRFAFALGVLAGISSLVPFIGPWIGAIPIELVALSNSPLQAIVVGVTYIVITNVVLQFLFPRIVGAAVKLPALAVIVAFIAGFSTGGILGMFVAIPVAATIAILFEHVYPRVYGSEVVLDAEQ
jgi:predicted PurR-regulated permease PerM